MPLRKEILEPAFLKYVDPFRILKGNGFRLKNFDPSDTCGLRLDKGDAAELLERGTMWLSEMQDMLYAQDRCLSGNGRRWQRQHDQARHVRRQSAGLPSLLV